MRRISSGTPQVRNSENEKYILHAALSCQLYVDSTKTAIVKIILPFQSSLESSQSTLRHALKRFSKSRLPSRRSAPGALFDDESV
jgi:hypothetical protein